MNAVLSKEIMRSIIIELSAIVSLKDHDGSLKLGANRGLKPRDGREDIGFSA